MCDNMLEGVAGPGFPGKGANECGLIELWTMFQDAVYIFYLLFKLFFSFNWNNYCN